MNEYEVVISKRVEEFLGEIEESARKKFIKAFSKVELGIKGDHFLKLSGTDNIFEFRIQDSGKWYRILAYPMRSETGFVFSTTHGFQKKGNKTPKKEIDIAERIRRGEK
jgi:phage-related protein